MTPEKTNGEARLSIEDLSGLNKNCWQIIKQYQNLQIHGTQVSAPYYINNIEGHIFRLMKEVGIKDEQIVQISNKLKNKEIPFGWFRGKGTPQEIEEATIKISEAVGIPLEKSTPESISHFMKLYGIGIDCSGLIYNTLTHTLSRKGTNVLDEVLDWEDTKIKSKYRAGAFTFAGKASQIIEPKDVRPLDLILIKKKNLLGYRHIAIVLAEDSGEFKVVQSSMNNESGINVSNLRIDENKPVFEYTPDFGENWSQLFKEGRLEFRRLNIIGG